jgi:hypothetical protein
MPRSYGKVSPEELAGVAAKLGFKSVPLLSIADLL